MNEATKIKWGFIIGVIALLGTLLTILAITGVNHHVRIVLLFLIIILITYIVICILVNYYKEKNMLTKRAIVGTVVIGISSLIFTVYEVINSDNIIDFTIVFIWFCVGAALFISRIISHISQKKTRLYMPPQ